MIKEAEVYLSNIVKSGLSPKTERSYRGSIEKLCKFFELENVRQIETISSEDFRRFIYDMNISSGSQNCHIRNLHAFIEWLKENDFIASENINSTKFFGKSKYLKQEKKPVFSLTDEEMKKIIAAAWGDQTALMIEFMLYTGLRREEVSNLKVSDIQDDGTFIVHGKGNKTVSLAMNAKLAKKMKKYLEKRDTDSQYVFYPTKESHFGENSEKKLSGIQINNRLKSAVSRTDISEERKSHITAHVLRKTLGTRIIEKYGIETAKQVLRHASIETTQRYNNSKLAENALRNISYETTS